MGMFDSAYALLSCPVCRSWSVPTEVQFKCGGRFCYPQCHAVKIGARLEGFPPIPRYEAHGWVCFECECEHSDDQATAVVVLERGVLTRVIYPVPEGHELEPLPRGRNTDRRAAAAEERYERAFREEQAKLARERREPGVGGDILAGLLGEIRREKLWVSLRRGRLLDAARILWNIFKDTFRRPELRGPDRIAFAMRYPLSHPVDYRRIGRRLLLVESMPGMPGEVSGNYERGDDCKWRRREEIPY